MAMKEIEGQTEAKESPSLDRIFYALETYSENLEEKLVKHATQTFIVIIQASASLAKPKNVVQSTPSYR